MTSRIHNPDTETDLALYHRLSSAGTRHFIMVAGAGSGKTTSLVKALAHIETTQGEQLRRLRQQVACVTYTEVAVEEIRSDVGRQELFHVSTIHSFLWSVIQPFQQDIHSWVRRRLDGKIREQQEKLEKPRTRQTTRDRAVRDIERYRQDQEAIESVGGYTYGTGSDYKDGVLGHSDILKIGPEFIQNHQLMRNVLVRRFPVILVDESQDTDPALVEALRTLAREQTENFCLGFFGDPMQKIYTQGAGRIDAEDGWTTLKKPENFRCPQRVLRTINHIRAEDDALEQTRGRMENNDGVIMPVQGTARAIVLQADHRRQERLRAARQWLAKDDEDPRWLDNSGEDLRVLVLVHRMAANRLNFPNLYAALNDKAPQELKSGLVDGTAWVLRPFLAVVLPLVLAHRASEDFAVMRMLRKHCPRLRSRQLTNDGATQVLVNLRDTLATLDSMLDNPGNYRIGDLVALLNQLSLVTLDDRFIAPLDVYLEDTTPGDPSPDNALHRFMRCDAHELWGYRKYIEELSPFATQQSIKGAEFEKVLVIIDDEEGRMNTFSYGKYFGVTNLSQTDQNNITQGNDSVIDRTRRLFYVCCSRARRDLCVIVFAHDPATMYEAIAGRGFFEPADLHLL